MTASLELFDGAFWRDPYPAYAALRADEPVRHVQLPDGPAWLLTRYHDVRAALTDPRFSKDWRYTLPVEARAASPAAPIPMMILMDPPGHTRLRKLVSRSFTARRMGELRPRIQRYAEDLLDALPTDRPVDLVAHYAALLPVRVICELLGVPATRSRGVHGLEPLDDRRRVAGAVPGGVGGDVRLPRAAGRGQAHPPGRRAAQRAGRGQRGR